MNKSSDIKQIEFSESLFWDVDLKKIDFEKHAHYIVERVVSEGEWNDFKAIINFYGKEKVADYVTQIRYLDNVVLNFCSTYFKQSKENYRCYTHQ